MNNLNINNQNGAALIICSVVLLAVLMLTVASMNNNKFNQRVITNFNSNIQSELGAEAARIEAENRILNNKPNTTLFVENCDDGLCKFVKTTKPWSKKELWLNSKQISTNLKQKSGIQEAPKYIIEYIGDKSAQDSISVGSQYGENQDTSTKPIYRVTSKAKGNKDNKETVIQTIMY